jgi:hypothetical protein
MMKVSTRILVFLALALFMGASASYAATISLVGTGDISNPSNSGSSDSYGNKVGFGGGALMDFRLMERTAFEVGGLYITRKLDDTTTGDVTQTHAIQVPVLLRFYLHPMISIGFGGYWAHASSDATSQGYKSSDYGLVGGAAVRFPLTQAMRLLVDVRYNDGLANVSTGDATIKNRDIQALVGFQFALGMLR